MTTAASRHRLENAALRMVTGLWNLLPEGLALSSGAALGRVVGNVLGIRRKEVAQHLEWVFPDRPVSWRRSVARASYAHFGREAVVVLRRGGWSTERVLAETSVVGFEDFRRVAESGKGLILLTGHLGNWEVGGASVAARGIPLDVVGKGMTNRRFQDDMFAVRERLGMRVIEMSEASREALRSLAEGRVLALLGDQHAHRGGVVVPFFGRPAATVRGPALFAARTGAAVWVAFATRDRGRAQRYTVRFEPLPFTSTGSPDQDAVALMGAYARKLEDAVKSAPEQYFWPHRRWKGGAFEEPGSDAQVT